jgi:hypothetical protein
MREFPSVIVPTKIDIKPAGSGDAYYRGDIGDEKMSIYQGVMFTEQEVHVHGSSSGDFNDFFGDKGWEWPALVYHEGVLLGQKLHTCEHYHIIFDPMIAASGVPFGFDVEFGSTSYEGLVYWRVVTPEE